MARISLFPFAALAVIGGLAAFGQQQGVYRNVDDEAVCAYEVADLETPSADILIAGASRVGQGLDPVYMQRRIQERTGQDITVERIVLNRPFITQFRPLLARYIANRGAPKHVVFPLLYNFGPERQRDWDLPINNLRNMTFANLDQLRDIQDGAQLNDHDTVLPRRFEAGYMSLPAMFMQKIEVNVFAALRAHAIWYEGDSLCAGDKKYRKGNFRVYDTVHDGLTFSDSKKAQERRARDAAVSAKFLLPSPGAPWRKFETGQMKAFISELEAAGSAVTLFVMPALGDTEISQAELDEIAEVFPSTRFIHPYSLFETEVGPDLAKSYTDTHHPTPYGAFIFSRFFADALAKGDL